MMNNTVWLRLPGYQVVAMKPEFREYAMELERTIRHGIPAKPDPARPDFYNLTLDEGEAYIHVYPNRRAIYLVAHSVSVSLAHA